MKSPIHYWHNIQSNMTLIYRFTFYTFRFFFFSSFLQTSTGKGIGTFLLLVPILLATLNNKVSLHNYNNVYLFRFANTWFCEQK